MVNRKGSLYIGALLTVVTFVAITWVSCSKGEGGPVRCEGVVCMNGGYCNMDTLTQKPKCTCPTGFEGANCGTAAVAKFIGTWDMQQVVTGSDSAGTILDTTYYTVALQNSATPTTFFISNFGNNKYYSEIVCTLDSTNSSNFAIDTLSAYHMIFDSYKLLYGYGYITTQDTIKGTFAVRHLTSTSNWVNDTVVFKLSPHKN